MRYIVTIRCEREDCRCLDRSGVITYDGCDKHEFERAKADVPDGYSVECKVWSGSHRTEGLTFRDYIPGRAFHGK